MNINSNYDDENTINFECCDKDVVYKVTQNGMIVKYYENMITDLNEMMEITIKNISNGDKIIFLNGKDGLGTTVHIHENIFQLPANYNGISIYYSNNLIQL